MWSLHKPFFLPDYILNFFRLVKRSPQPQFFGGFGRGFGGGFGRGFGGGFGGRGFGRGRGRGRGFGRLATTAVVIGGAALAGGLIGQSLANGGGFGK